MLRTFFFAVKMGLLVAVFILAARQKGFVALEWGGYHIKADTGFALAAVILFLLGLLFIHRLTLLLASLPERWKKRKETRQYEKGYEALTEGLSAVAAGDAALAAAQAKKTRTLWPQDHGLCTLLEAQAARLRGEEDAARASFEKLLKNKSTAFLGLRGLLVNALEDGDTRRALELAQQAQKMHPRLPWIVHMVYDLQIQRRQWDQAESSLRGAVKFGVTEAEKAAGERIAMLLARAEDDLGRGAKDLALKWLRTAHGLDRGFVPAAERLAAFYIDTGREKKAVSVLEETWRLCPHPDLVPLWEAAAPYGKKADERKKMEWFERLVALKPDSAEGQMAAAQAALDEGLWGQAREYLHMADQLHPSARLYRLYALLEEKTGHREAAAQWLLKAADAPPDRVWTCRQTGRIFERWMPVTKPEGHFNTVVWDYPHAGKAFISHAAFPQNEILVTAK